MSAQNEIIIREYENGVAFFGALPIPLLDALVRHYKKETGLHLADSVSGMRLGATIVLTSNAKIEGMRREAEEAK